MKKILSTLLVFMVILTAFSGYVNASTAAISFAPSNSNISVGKEFEVTLSLTDLGVFTDGVNSASGILSFDSNYVSFVAMYAESPWILNLYNESNGRFLLLTPNMTSVQTGDLISFRFKLNAKPSETTKLITLTETSITDGMTDEVTFNPVHITLTVNEPVTPPSSENNTTTNTTTNNTVTNGTTNNTTTNNIGNNIANNTANNNTTDNTTINNAINNTTGNNITDNNTLGNDIDGNNTNNDNNTPTIVINTTDSSKNPNGTNSSYISSDKTTSTNKIPYAGFNSFIILSIIIAIVSGIYGYYKYKYLDK